MTIQTTHISADIIVIGAGGAGIMASLQAARLGLKVVCISKVPPLCSHTVAAKGGINAALGNVSEDNYKWHIYDTIKGSDWLADQDAVEFMCRNAAGAIRDLEKMGVPFSRLENGKIYQRIYGGQLADYGKGAPVYRACAASDRTGQAILNALYQQALKHQVRFYEHNFALDLLMENGACRGVAAWDMANGAINIFSAPFTIIASGGYGQIYKTNTSAAICTGDGNAMVLRAGLPVCDMEFVQFHPTGLYNCGFLVTEAARGEGGYLINNKGERFMANYAPKSADLASRDVIARAMATEINQGRGVGQAGDHLLLQLSHINPQILHSKLPEVIELARKFAGIDIFKEPIPVAPSAHYSMGGVPTNLAANVQDAQGKNVPGLLAIGEAACVSVHGANRLGCNSLLDLIVFGKAAADSIKTMHDTGQVPQYQKISQNLIDKIMASLNDKIQRSGDIKPAIILHDMQQIMASHAGVFRDEQGLADGEKKIRQLINGIESLNINESTLLWNNSLIEALELENMLLQALATIICARQRTESRGSHFRNDYNFRDDINFLSHSLLTIDENLQANYSKRQVRMLENAEFLPEERHY